MFDFNEQLRKGENGEEFLDKKFADKFEIYEVDMNYQRKGIDRIFIDKKYQCTYTVEYKTDWKAASTGNAFIETISVNKDNKLGWAYTSQAQVLIYRVPNKYILVLDMLKIKQHLPKWIKKYRSAACRNKGYSSHGTLVPLEELKKLTLPESFWK